MKTKVGCTVLLISGLLLPVLFEVLNIQANMWKVDQLCSSTKVPEIHDHVLWEKWNHKVRNWARTNNIDWKWGLTSEQGSALRRVAEQYDMSIVGFNGHPFKYPFSGVWVPGSYLYKGNKRIATLKSFVTYSDMGPINHIIRDAGKIYTCDDRYNEARRQSRALFFYYIPIRREFRWKQGDMK